MKNRKITSMANHEGNLRSGQGERLHMLLSEAEKASGGGPVETCLPQRADAPVDKDPQVPCAFYIGK